MATGEEFALVDGKKLKIKVYVNKCAAIDCPTGEACQPGAVCDPRAGTCVFDPPPPEGSPCPDGSCFHGMCLPAGICGNALIDPCGNGVCEMEEWMTCPADCHCGNGFASQTWTKASSPAPGIAANA